MLADSPLPHPSLVRVVCYWLVASAQHATILYSCFFRRIKHCNWGNKEFLQLCKIRESEMQFVVNISRKQYPSTNQNFFVKYVYINKLFSIHRRFCVFLYLQWWQVEKVNPIKLYEENKVIAGFSLLNLLFKQGRCSLVKKVMDKLLCLYTQKKIRPVVDSLWALEEVRE